MKRWWIVYVLPLEVWMDIFVFPWVSRKQFAQLVDRIGNWKFAKHAQFYLHEWGKHELSGDGLREYSGKLCRLEYPQTPMPENIKSFGCIQIKHFDAKSLDFFDKIRPLLALADLEFSVNCIPPNCLENLHTILTHLVPMLDGIRIRSVHCDSESAIPILKEHLFRDNEKLDKLKRLEINFSSASATVSEMEQQEMVEYWILNPTVGRIDAASQKVVPPVDGKRNDKQQKPCSSKDA